MLTAGRGPNAYLNTLTKQGETMTDTPPADSNYPPVMDGLDAADCRSLTNLFVDIDQATKLPKLGHWAAELAHCLHHRTAELSGIDPVCPGGVVPPLSTLTESELLTLRGLFSAEADHAVEAELHAAEDWLSQLLWLISAELDGRPADRALFNARAAAMSAEEMRRDRADRPSPDLSGLPSWPEVSRDADD
jgi:hypothetical protein